MFMVYSGYDVMTKPDFAELKERLCRKQYVDIYVQREHDTAIIIELLEIIQSQSEVIERTAKEMHSLANIEYDKDYTDLYIAAENVLSETNTRLQKLRDGK